MKKYIIISICLLIAFAGYGQVKLKIDGVFEVCPNSNYIYQITFQSSISKLSIRLACESMG